MEKYTSKHVKETASLAKKIIAALLKRKKNKHAAILALYGDLGAGKTNFAQAVAKALGVKETVPSPTFILERVYTIKQKPFARFIHIDAYRIERAEDLKHIGWDEIKKDPTNLILVEWADKIEKALPKDAMKIYFEHAEERARVISIMNYEA